MTSTAPNAKRKTRNAKPSSNPGGGKSPAELVRKSNQWRDSYNPLRSLVISRVVAMLEAAERGDFAELQLTLRKVEKRYPVLKALIARRCGAIEKLNWDVKVPEVLPDGVTPEQAEAQRAHLRARYDLVENLTDAFGQLALAEFRGYTLLQKHRFTGGEHDGAVRELHWLPQFNWVREGQFGDFYYNADCRFGITAPAVALGESNRLPLRPSDSQLSTLNSQLARTDFVFRECDAPLYEIALIAFVNWCMGRKDWAAFVEIFGLPNAIVILPANIPQGSEDEYRSAAEKVADGVSGALPNGSDAKFPTASVRGNAPFKEFCEAMDADLVLAGTGGLLTMLSLPQGIGGGASGEHGDAFADIAQADARRITSTLQRDFDGPELDEAFPGQPHLAYFELAAEDADDTDKLVANAVALKGAGYAVKGEWLAERTGYEMAEAEERGLQPAETPGGKEDDLEPDLTAPGAGDSLRPEGRAPAEAPLRNRAAAQPSTLTSQLREAFAADLQPARERLARILSISDDALLETKLREFVAEFPQLVNDITADPRSARVLEAQMGSAAANGLASGGPLRNRRILNSNPDQPRDEDGRWSSGGAGMSVKDMREKIKGTYGANRKEADDHIFEQTGKTAKNDLVHDDDTVEKVRVSAKEKFKDRVPKPPEAPAPAPAPAAAATKTARGRVFESASVPAYDAAKDGGEHEPVRREAMRFKLETERAYIFQVERPSNLSSLGGGNEDVILPKSKLRRDGSGGGLLIPAWLKRAKEDEHGPLDW